MDRLEPLEGVYSHEVKWTCLWVPQRHCKGSMSQLSLPLPTKYVFSFVPQNGTINVYNQKLKTNIH